MHVWRHPTCRFVLGVQRERARLGVPAVVLGLQLFRHSRRHHLLRGGGPCSCSSIRLFGENLRGLSDEGISHSPQVRVLHCHNRYGVLTHKVVDGLREFHF